MATKLEEANVAPAGLVENASPERHSDIAPAGQSDRSVDNATSSLNNLAVIDKETAINEGTQENVENDATPLPTTAAVPTSTPPADTTGPVWPETAPSHPLTKFYDNVETLVKKAQHDEVYGIHLSKTNSFHTKLILQKFLRANQNDLDKAKQQLLETLEWRKEFDPVKAINETFDRSRFGGLGYVLEVEGVPESKNAKDIATFNIYGAVKDKKATFGDMEGFLRWRVGLMEKSVQALNLSSATSPIPDFGSGPDPYQGFQIHDYLQVSFLRQDPAVKAATSKTIEVLGRYYPETLSRKFFVNVPVIMGWMYTAAKLIVAKETAKKFAVLSYGNQLAEELGKNIPAVYGGTRDGLESIAEGMTLV